MKILHNGFNEYYSFTLGIPAILLIGWTANKKNNSWSHSHNNISHMYMHIEQNKLNPGKK